MSDANRSSARHASQRLLQQLGRDLHWLLAREVLETRKPKLLVIEVTESEPRSMHPAFPYLDDVRISGCYAYG